MNLPYPLLAFLGSLLSAACSNPTPSWQAKSMPAGTLAAGGTTPGSASAVSPVAATAGTTPAANGGSSHPMAGASGASVSMTIETHAAGAAAMSGRVVGTADAGKSAPAQAGNGAEGAAGAHADCGANMLPVPDDLHMRGPWGASVKTLKAGRVTLELFYPALKGSGEGKTEATYNHSDWLPMAEHTKTTANIAPAKAIGGRYTEICRSTTRMDPIPW